MECLVISEIEINKVAFKIHVGGRYNRADIYPCRRPSSLAGDKKTSTLAKVVSDCLFKQLYKILYEPLIRNIYITKISVRSQIINLLPNSLISKPIVVTL